MRRLGAWPDTFVSRQDWISGAQLAWSSVISSHAVFATSLSEALAQDASLRRQVSICNHYSRRAEAPHHPAIFLLDLCCPGLEPNTLCGLLRRKHPGSKLVCLISPGQAQEEYMLRLFFSGVEGIVCLKERSPAELRGAVRDVLNGQLCILRACCASMLLKPTRFWKPVMV